MNHALAAARSYGTSGIGLDGHATRLVARVAAIEAPILAVDDRNDAVRAPPDRILGRLDLRHRATRLQARLSGQKVDCPPEVPLIRVDPMVQVVDDSVAVGADPGHVSPELLTVAVTPIAALIFARAAQVAALVVDLVADD